MEVLVVRMVVARKMQMVREWIVIAGKLAIAEFSKCLGLLDLSLVQTMKL